jgi:hypothetical protein
MSAFIHLLLAFPWRSEGIFSFDIYDFDTTERGCCAEPLHLKRARQHTAFQHTSIWMWELYPDKIIYTEINALTQLNGQSAYEDGFTLLRFLSNLSEDFLLIKVPYALKRLSILQSSPPGHQNRLPKQLILPPKHQTVENPVYVDVQSTSDQLT